MRNIKPKDRRGKVLMLVLLLSGVFWSCSPEGRQADTGEVHPADTMAALPPVDTVREILSNFPKAFGDLDSMVARRQLRALVPYNHTYYYVDGKERHGIAYEDLFFFEMDLNKELGSRVPKVFVVYIPVPRDRIVSMLSEGYGDLAVANLTITPGRDSLVDFSMPVRSDVREVLVTGPASPPLDSLEDLAGQRIMVMAGSSHLESLRELNERFRRQGLEPIKIETADEFMEEENLLELLNVGAIPLTVSDLHIVEVWTEAFDSISIREDLTLSDSLQVAWAFRHDSPQLAAVVNKFVRTHRKGSWLGNVIFNRYLKHNRYIKHHTSAQTRDRYRNLQSIFRKYAELYDIDWHFLIAQGYQESMLDHTLVSRAGAVGIMQVKPSTAKGPPVYISDVRNVENNIHAGAKYLNYIMEDFLEEDIDPLNRHLLALASYNAGPTRIKRLRAKAGQMGLDEDKWFRNVEQVVAREIGRETIQYVGNVYKYYLTFRFTETFQELSDSHLTRN